jgi:hypothetical protein
VGTSDHDTISSGCTTTPLGGTLGMPQRMPLVGGNADWNPRPSRRFSLGAFQERTRPLVSFFPCSECGQRAVGKLAAIYANWFTEDDKREAYRMRLCVTCLTRLMEQLKKHSSGDSGLLTICPLCGEDSSTKLSGVYLTIYPPKQPEREYALTMCNSCAPLLQAPFLERGDKLGDRSVGAAAPTNAASAEWSQVPW